MGSERDDSGPGMLEDIDVDEVALVSRGANRRRIVWKAAHDETEEEQTMTDKEKGMPTGTEGAVVQLTEAADPASYVPIQKADGSWDYSAIPEPARKSIEAAHRESLAARAEVTALKGEVAVEKAARRKREAEAEVAKAYPQLSEPEKRAALLVKADDAGIGAEVRESLALANVALAESQVLKARGLNKTMATGSAAAQLAKIARDKVTGGGGRVTLSQAYDQAIRENAELVRQHEAEQA